MRNSSRSFRSPEWEMKKNSRLPLSQSVEVYTILRVLKQIKKELGLEAMVDFHASYIEQIDRYNPHLVKAVDHAIRILDTKRVYRALVEDSILGKKEEATE